MWGWFVIWSLVVTEINNSRNRQNPIFELGLFFIFLKYFSKKKIIIELLFMKEIYWVVILFPTCVLGIGILFRLVYCGPVGFILPLFILKNFTKQNKKILSLYFT